MFITLRRSTNEHPFWLYLSFRFRCTVRIFCFGTTLALLISSSALAADTASEVKTAAMHAGLASQAANVEGVHTHLHHTLNCLVGPDGDGFDSDEMNPCGDMGNGAIPDTKDDDMKKNWRALLIKPTVGSTQTIMTRRKPLL